MCISKMSIFILQVKTLHESVDENLKQKSRAELKELLCSLKDETFILNCSIDEFKTEVSYFLIFEIL
jgi:hypothetical protein